VDQIAQCYPIWKKVDQLQVRIDNVPEIPTAVAKDAKVNSLYLYETNALLH